MAGIDKKIEALFRIAFDEDVSCLAGDLCKWPTTIAYLALGGKIENGQRKTSKEELEKRNIKWPNIR